MYLADITTSITSFVTTLYTHTSLVGILLAMAIESCCIPLPSEIVMPLAGVMLVTGKILGGINPVLGIILVALAGSVGCLVGSMAAYGIGYAGGRPLMLKYGRYVLISHHDADRADAFFKKYGSATAFFSRLLPVVRTYISLPAGIAEMPFGKFCIYTFLGSFPWCVLLAYVGTVIGNNLTKLNATLGPIFSKLDIVIIVLIVLLVALYIWRHIRNDRRARAAHAAEEAAKAASTQQQQQAQNGWDRQPQQGWGQQPQQFQPPQQGWNGQPISPRSVPPQQGWDQQSQPPQPFQPQQGWGGPAQPQLPPSPQFPQQQGGVRQSPSQEQWPSQNGHKSQDGQWR